MYAELHKRCSSGDQIACWQLFLLLFLLPRLERLLRRLKTETPAVFIPRPRSMQPAELADLLRDRAFFDSLVQSGDSLVPDQLGAPAQRREALRAIRTELTALLGEVEEALRKVEE